MDSRLPPLWSKKQIICQRASHCWLMINFDSNRSNYIEAKSFFIQSRNYPILVEFQPLLNKKLHFVSITHHSRQYVQKYSLLCADQPRSELLFTSCRCLFDKEASSHIWSRPLPLYPYFLVILPNLTLLALLNSFFDIPAPLFYKLRRLHFLFIHLAFD